MKRLIVLILLLVVPSVAFAESVFSNMNQAAIGGSRLADTLYSGQLTDASPTYTSPMIKTTLVKGVVVDVATDKGMTVTIVPVLDETGLFERGDLTAGVIADGGVNNGILYSPIYSRQCYVEITKTEAGSTSEFQVSIRGVN